MSDVNIQFSYDFSVSPVSTNDMYFHMPKKTKNGRMTTYTIKSPELKNFQSTMKGILSEIYPNDILDTLKELVGKNTPYGLSLVMIFLMPPDNYISSDTSNYIKSLEDTIVSYTGIDDRYNIVITAAKGLSYDDDWHIMIHTGVCPKIGASDVKSIIKSRSVTSQSGEISSEVPDSK